MYSFIVTVIHPMTYLINQLNNKSIINLEKNKLPLPFHCKMADRQTDIRGFILLMMVVVMMQKGHSQNQDGLQEKISRCQNNNEEMVCRWCGLQDNSFSAYCCDNEAFYHLCWQAVNNLGGDGAFTLRAVDKKKTYFLGKRTKGYLDNKVV